MRSIIDIWIFLICGSNPHMSAWVDNLFAPRTSASSHATRAFAAAFCAEAAFLSATLPMFF